MNERNEIYAFRIKVQIFDSFLLMNTLTTHLGESYVSDLQDIGAIGYVEEYDSDGFPKIAANGLCRFPECGLIFEDIQNNAVYKDLVDTELQHFLTVENERAL